MDKYYQGPEYKRVHSVLRKENGLANHCSNQECSGKSNRFNWALKKGHTYTTDINDYIPLCVSCHRKYDHKPEFSERSSRDNKGKVCHNRMRVVMSVSMEDNFLYLSSAHASRATGISKTSINNCLCKRSNTAGGLKWIYRDKI
jgi:hypothetical protein